MSDAPDITIPKVFEGYADVRVVWFGQGASVAMRNNNGVADVSHHKDTSAFRQLAGLNLVDGGYELATNGESDVAGLDWNKDTESPAGVLGMSLFPRRPYKNLISPDDVLLVYGKADKRAEETFIALISVDTISESRTVSGSGATIVRYNVQGRDLGKILMETPTVFDAAFGGLVASRFYAQFLNAFTLGTAQGGPSVVVQTMLAIFFSLRQNFVTQAIGQSIEGQPSLVATNPATNPLLPWRFPGNRDLSLFEFIDTSSFVQTPMVGALIAEASLLQNAANLWQLCDMYSNRIVNEFYIDTRDLVPGYDTAHKRMGYYAQQFLKQYGDSGSEQVDQSKQISDALSLSTLAEDDFNVQLDDERRSSSIVALVHRQLPYDTYSFYSLPTTIVYETEVFSDNTSYSSHDVVNMFRIRFPGIIEGVAQDLQYGVHINRDSIEKHGLRRYEGESIYVWTNAKDENNNASIRSYHPTFQFYQSLVTTWFAYNDRMQSGSMSMRFRPDIRVGTRLTYVKRSPNGTILVSDFYVQRVQHSYSPNPGQSRTNVDLVRGVERDGLTIPLYQETHLFWTHEGGALDPNPYEVVVSEDVFGASQGPSSVPIVDPAPGDK